jgi:hypothetical protein
MNHRVVPEIRVCPICSERFLVGGEGRRKRTAIYCSQLCSGRKVNQPLSDMTEAQVAWLAGVVDGEGYVCLQKRSSVQIRISQCDRRLLERIVEITGVGSIHRQRAATEKHRASHVWTVGSDNAIELLRRMLPWLIVKADVAREAIGRRQFTIRLRAG